MRALIFFVFSISILTLSSCNKTKYGNATFWQKSGSGYGVTVVNVEGVTSNISDEYDNAPDCGASGCAVFNHLETGVYLYSASDGNASWSGTFNVSDNGCTTIELY